MCSSVMLRIVGSPSPVCFLSRFQMELQHPLRPDLGWTCALRGRGVLVSPLQAGAPVASGDMLVSGVALWSLSPESDRDQAVWNALSGVDLNDSVSRRSVLVEPLAPEEGCQAVLTATRLRDEALRIRLSTGS